MRVKQFIWIFVRSNYNNETGLHKSWNFHKYILIFGLRKKIARSAKAGVFQ